MVRKWTGAAVLVVALTLVSGCDFIDVNGSGGGAPELTNFQQGFAFVRSDDRNVFVADKSDGFQALMQVTENGNNSHPSLSHDGRRVVFVHKTAAGTEIQIATLGSTAAPSVVFASDATRKNFRHPVFSPDDSTLVFSYDEPPTAYLGKVGVTGSGFQRMGTGSIAYGSPSFYPDGRSVLAISGDLSSGYTRLERVNLTTGAGTSVTNSLGDALAVANRAVVSPNGNLIAFDGRIASGATRIFLYDVLDMSTQQLTDYPGEPNARDSFPTWIGNSEVGFSNDIGGADQVYSISTAASLSTGKLVRASAIEPWYGP